MCGTLSSSPVECTRVRSAPFVALTGSQLGISSRLLLWAATLRFAVNLNGAREASITARIF